MNNPIGQTEIKSVKSTQTTWQFIVNIEGIDFSVELDKEYWEKLTDGRQTPAELVRHSFEFLLTKEPKESIHQLLFSRI